MALLITITDAGRAEIINADNTGTGPVVITEIGFGTGQYAPNKAQTALVTEIKRVSSIAGLAVAADTIHVMAKDEGTDAYNVGEFGLYSASGTLVAVYSQDAAAGWIIQKAGASTLLLAVDIILESLDAASLAFGDITFLNPPATTETPGVVQLEDSLTSASTTKALTAKQGKLLQDSKQPLDATLTALAALATAADRLIYATGSDTFATTPLSAFIRTLLDDANGPAALATLGAAPLNSAALTGTPTAPTPAQATNNTQLATTAFVKAAIAALIDSSPGALDTLNELAAALGDDPNFATTVTNALAGKQALHANLTALSGLVGAADKISYFTGVGAMSLTALTAKARTLLASADESAMRTFLGLVKQASATDNSPGVLMTLGAFGLGASSTVAVPGGNIDTLNVTGFYFVSGNAGTLPPAGYAGELLHFERGSSNQALQFFDVLRGAGNLQALYTRTRRTDGTWTTWAEVAVNPAELSPPGAVVHFARNTAPSGWLKANGAAVSRTTYATLFAAIGTTFGAGDGSTTFSLPDLRGEFTRGWDDERGLDSGRVMGSPQGHATEFHNHTLPTGSSSLNAASGIWGVKDLYWEEITGPNINPTPVSGEIAVTGSTGHQAYASAVAGNYAGETRPRNIALLACVKY